MSQVHLVVWQEKKLLIYVLCICYVCFGVEYRAQVWVWGLAAAGPRVPRLGNEYQTRYEFRYSILYYRHSGQMCYERRR